MIHEKQVVMRSMPLYLIIGLKVDSLFFGRANGKNYMHRGPGFSTPHEELVSRACSISFSKAITDIRDILAVESSQDSRVSGGRLSTIIHLGDEKATGLIMTPHAAIETAITNRCPLRDGGFYDVPPLKVFPRYDVAMDFYLEYASGSRIVVASQDIAKSVADEFEAKNYLVRVSKREK